MNNYRPKIERQNRNKFIRTTINTSFTGMV